MIEREIKEIEIEARGVDKMGIEERLNY